MWSCGVAEGVSAPSLSKLVVFGVGLIGGSFSLAMRRAGMVRDVVGIGRDAANLDTARRSGIADRTYALRDKWQHELADVDLVLVAVPVGQMRSVFAQIAPAFGAHSVITDAGSTKQDVIAAARSTLASALARFVPAHPIAGTERSGAAAAFATLYEGRSVLLAPVAETSVEAIALVEACWSACGARVARIDAARHDQLFAAVSHLPHALAFALDWRHGRIATSIFATRQAAFAISRVWHRVTRRCGATFRREQDGAARRAGGVRRRAQTYWTASESGRRRRRARRGARRARGMAPESRRR